MFIVQSGSPSVNREDPGGVDLNCNNFSPRPCSAAPREGGVVESFKSVTSLTDGSADKLPVNFLIISGLYHPNYLPVFTVDVEMSSLVIRIIIKSASAPYVMISPHQQKILILFHPREPEPSPRNEISEEDLQSFSYRTCC